ncbi:MAG TPA: hypothetical protein VFZ04_20475 [Longimicrobiales bacterium]
MTRFQHIGFLVLAILLLLFLAIFPVLTIDAIGKLLTRAAQLERGNLVLVLYLELSRAFTTLTAVLTALFLVLRSAREPDGRALALFLIFSALTYEKIFGATGYPGPLQEKFTLALLDAGVPRGVLYWLFGSVPWSLWLALAAIMRFSVVFPRPPLSAEAIDASGAQDRRGMLRGSGIAGFDIGAGLRSISKRALRAGAFRPVPIWLAAGALIVITTLLTSTVRLAAFAITATAVTALAITNLRASYRVVAEREKVRVRWLLLGFAIAGAFFVLASLPLLISEHPLVTVPALVLLMLAPAAIMVCGAMAVLYRGALDPRGLLALRRVSRRSADGV